MDYVLQTNAVSKNYKHFKALNLDSRCTHDEVGSSTPRASYI